MSDKSDKGMSRRQFLGLTGGVVGAAALASIGFKYRGTKNERKIDPENMNYKENETDILVIGGGMTGLFAAVKGHDAGAKVLMVSKGRLGSSGQTPFAKGIFSYDAATASVSLDEFTEQVSSSALKTNNPVFTRQMAEHSKARVDELREWGFFDSPLYYDSFSKPINERNISVMERIMITHLIKENGKIAGAAGFSIDEPTIHIFKAKSVILCTGAGGFKPNGFPICDLTHDGSVMAYKIGAKITGKEWNDGHGGSMDNPAACYDGWHGMFAMSPSKTGVEIHHDLGVDINYRAYVLGNPVSMMPGGDNTIVEGGPYVPEKFVRNREAGAPPGGGNGDKMGPPPGAEAGDRPSGPPPGGEEGRGPGMAAGASSGGASAGMAIHKSEGLVPINEKGESNIPGLYAAGDALGSYMAGAIYTQVGSSLAGSAVQGTIASEAAAEYCQKAVLQNIPSSKISRIKEEILAPLKRDSGYSPAWVTQILQGVMIPNFVIYIKKESILKAALAYVEELRDHHSPMLRAADLHELRLAHETENMIVNAEMKLKASLMRKESRCSHYRLDYPDVDYKNWQAWINIYKGSDGEMKFVKQPFDSWPV
ncbi:MAG: FAD-binding protein [Spirochaetales bacterium]|uniref:FAD-binding protein n=1 Tax=Candidatus Thalassospirochaeta sargassi TaxID=3119039 RepID=A0AAJ1MPD6_9SPIO|nr:FAD-binding protein [Spirochaetales bacterium]